jgi:hypothetical protein
MDENMVMRDFLCLLDLGKFIVDDNTNGLLQTWTNDNCNPRTNNSTFKKAVSFRYQKEDHDVDTLV